MAGKTVAGELYESITGQLFEIGRQLRQPSGYPFDPEKLKSCLQNAIEGKFERRIIFSDNLPDIDWVKVYEVLGMAKEFAEFVNANSEKLTPRTGLWIVLVVKSVTPNKVMAALKKLKIGTWQYTADLDKDVPTNDRDPNRDGSYTVSFRKTVEADPELTNKSAYMLAEEGVKAITLLERLLLELGYYLTTGKHLDEDNVTLCSGSRYYGGYVPGVSWRASHRKICVSWRYANDREGNLRARVAA